MLLVIFLFCSVIFLCSLFVGGSGIGLFVQLFQSLGSQFLVLLKLWWFFLMACLSELVNFLEFFITSQGVKSKWWFFYWCCRVVCVIVCKIVCPNCWSAQGPMW